MGSYEGRGPQTDKHLPQSSTWIFLDDDIALPSMSLIILRAGCTYFDYI
jgi:hypothetical protein